MIYKDMKLHEWIAEGRVNGTIRDVLTVIWAYCMDESSALKWVAAIVSGQVHEQEALTALQSNDCVEDAINELNGDSAVPQADDVSETGRVEPE